eukprot:Clim_evm14s208 gene=Clim_evmTU14s208
MSTTYANGKVAACSRGDNHVMVTAPTPPDHIPHIIATQRSSITESTNIGIKNRAWQKRISGEIIGERNAYTLDATPSNRNGADVNGFDSAHANRDDLVDTKAGIKQVVAGFLTFMVIGVLSQSWGVYIPRISEDLNEGVSLVAWPGALALALRAGAAPWAGSFSSRWGTRRIIAIGGLLAVVGMFSSTWVTVVWELYITYGVLVGVGMSLIMYPTVGLVIDWYRRKKAYALGWAMAGLGIGGFIYAPTASLMIKRVGWRATMRGSVIGVVILLAVALVLVEDLRPKKRKQTTLDLHLFREPRFTLLFLHNVFFAYSYAAPFFFTVTWAEIYGINSTVAAFASGLVSFSSAASKPLLGWIGDRTSRPGVFIFSLVSAALALYVYPQCHTGASLIIINIVFGAFAGIFFMQSAVVHDWFPSYDPARITGLSGAGRGIGELVGPVSVGAILSSNPGLAFYVSGAMMNVCALLMLLAYLWPKISWVQPRSPTEIHYNVDYSMGDPAGHPNPVSERHLCLQPTNSNEDTHGREEFSDGLSEDNHAEELEMHSLPTKMHHESLPSLEYVQVYADFPQTNLELEPWKPSSPVALRAMTMPCPHHHGAPGLLSPATQ